jgi:beta-glucanase (GH16 family)
VELLELRLLWQEEFGATYDGRPNDSLWTFDVGDGTMQGIPGWGNQEREYYVESNATVGSGLSIRAEKVQHENPPTTYYGPAEWLSSKIHTLGKVSFRYGRFDFEVQAPTGGGSWPAIWMLGVNIADATWPSCGEIDIFEGAGNRPHEVRGTLHGPGYCADQGITGEANLISPISQGTHTFSIEWLPNEIRWLVNEREYLRIHRDDLEILDLYWPFNDFFYLIINLAMGGWFAGEISEDLEVCIFRINAIKHYSIDGVGEIRFEA